MDWERIEQDVHFQTQQALVSASSVKDDVNKTFINSHFYDPVTRDEQLVDYRSRHNKKALQASLIDKSSLEGYVNDLRNVTVIQSKKVLSIENILSTYSEVFESSSAAQTSLEMRIQDIEQNIRGNNKFASDASKERSALSITVKSISGKVATIEDSLQNNEHCYATKEAFAQLLDSTVDEIKSVGAVVSQANVKSAQSVTLIEALIQAIHRMRGQTDNFSVDDTDRSLSFEFLSSLTGERQREQVVRLLRESMHGSVTAVAKEVVCKEAESICSSVNGMLTTLNGQLMQSVEELGRQTKATCNIANIKATQSLAATTRLESQQSDLVRSIEVHLDRTREQVATQFQGSMEGLGEVLEDVASVQKTVKRDLQSFECELAEQRKMLYVEVGLHKEAQSNLLLTYSSLERSHNTETCALDKRIHDLECEIKSMKEITRKDNEERGGNITSSELSKEVINALVTEVILAETIDRRNKEVLDSSALLVKQQEHLSLLNQGAEERMAAQLEAYKSAFKAEMCAMVKQLEIGHAESVQSMKQSALDAADWQLKQEGQMRDLQRVLIDQDDTQAEVIKQLRDELSKKSDELSTTIATIRDKERVSAESATAAASAVRSDLVNLQMAVEGLLKDRDKEQGTVARNASDTTAFDILTAEVAKVGSKASDAQTALAKMHVRSMYMQDEVKAASDAAKDIRSLVAELAASVELLEKKEAAPPPPVAHMQQVSGEQFKRLETRMDTAVTAVNAVVSAARKENEVGSKKMADDLSAFHIRMTEEIKSLRSALVEKEGVAKQKESNPLPAAEAESLKRISVALSAVEKGMDVLHGEVVHQGQQSILLEAKVCQIAQRVDLMDVPDTHRKGVEEHRGISRGKILGTGGSGSGEIKPSSSSGAPIQPAGDISSKPTVTVRGDTTEILPTYGSKVLPSAAVSVPSTEHQQNIFSNSSSITNSLASSRSPSAVVLTTLESKIDSPDSGTTKPKLIVQNVEEENKVMSLNCYSPRDGSSCDGSETAASPLSIPAPIPSPPGTAVRRRIHDATAAAATAAAAAEGQSSGGKVAEGQSSGGKVADAQFSGGKVTQVARRTPTPAEKKAAQEKLQFEEEIAKVEMSHIYGKREEVMKQIGSRKNSATEEMMPTNIVASPARDSSKEVKIQEPLPSPSVTTKGPNQEKSSSPLSDDEEDFSLGEPDDDEENSMSASSDLDIYNGRRLVMGSANKTPLPHGRGSTSEVLGNSQSAEDVEALADMSSSFETSQSAGKTSGSLRAHLSAHFDPLDRSGESGSGTHTPDSRERRTSLVPLAPIPRTLSPSTSTPSIPNVTGVVPAKGSAMKSASASAPDDISNSASAPLPFTSMPLYGSITVPATVPGRSPQPVLSGSLLSTGRRSAAPLVHKPAQPKISSEPGSKLQAGAGSGKLGSNQTKSKDLDDDGNLDFDSSSWDEDDDAEISG